MRIVIDLQGAQSKGSRNRGIGRYSEALASAICRNRGSHDIHIVLSNAFSHTIDPIRAIFEPLISPANIHVFEVFTPTEEAVVENSQRRKTNEIMREAFIGQLRPDAILVASLFEGFLDDAVTSIKLFNNIPTSVVLYDLIPLIHHKPYLENPVVEKWYLHKIDHLKRADLLLSISASSGQEAIDYLGFNTEKVINISTACDPKFQPLKLNDQDYHYFSSQYNIHKQFIMYTGGIDHRKNIEGLIRSFSLLPQEIQKQHQLVIVCSVHDPDRQRLTQLAEERGLTHDNYIMTGFVPEDDLIKLYNACKLFVFPSWHEGFGLPALEAMQCGKPVLASNTSSLPEVVNNPEALFDPRSDIAIMEKILEALTDDAMRHRLAQHGLEQAKNFNWEDIAKRSIRAIECQYIAKVEESYLPKTRKRLAFVSPLPPECSGISDYSAELLEELTRWYQIDVVVNQAEVITPWIKANCDIRSIEWFRKNAGQFDRVMYHFGNSEFHKYMFELLEEFPGIVVLHDFFLSGIQNYRDALGWAPNVWKKNLYHSHGYKAVWVAENESYANEALWTYPTNLKVIQDSLGIIVHSKNSILLAEKWYGSKAAKDWKLIPHLRKLPTINGKEQARENLGIEKDAFLICSFGIIGKTKQSLKILEAFIDSKLSKIGNCYLVFVGQNDGSEYGVQIENLIAEAGLEKQVKITGWASIELFRLYLQASDMGVQLRTLSRGETSGTVLDCMNYGLATIINANGSMADINSNCVYKLADKFSHAELVIALEKIYSNPDYKERIGANAVEEIRSKHSPRNCARLYAEAIESSYEWQFKGFLGFASHVQDKAIVLDYNDPSILRKLSNNFPALPPLKQIFIDVSELVIKDAHSGIQRVVRSILKELMHSPPEGYRIEPVFAVLGEQGYCYARQFSCKFLGISDTRWAVDEEIEFAQGDIFLGLDLHPVIAVQQKSYLSSLRAKGVKIAYIIYDLLAISKSQYFMREAFDIYTPWLKTVTSYDEVICISRAVADEVFDWLNTFGEARDRPLIIDWFHLGADIENSMPTVGIPSNSTKILNTITVRPTFLMVGTLEPRKGHKQVLEAFDQLWSRDTDINLVIVGKRGWLIDELIEQIEVNREYRKRLFWLDGISDEYVSEIYSASSCLIAASYGEGFGLPLIEAAQHNLPVIARDIPVFREVAGEYALYFSDEPGADIVAKVVEEWLALSTMNSQPKSADIPWLTWHQSTHNLLRLLINGNEHYRQWQNNDKT